MLHPSLTKLLPSFGCFPMKWAMFQVWILKSKFVLDSSVLDVWFSFILAEQVLGRRKNRLLWVPVSWATVGLATPVPVTFCSPSPKELWIYWFTCWFLIVSTYWRIYHTWEIVQFAPMFRKPSMDSFQLEPTHFFLALHQYHCEINILFLNLSDWICHTLKEIDFNF